MSRLSRHTFVVPRTSAGRTPFSTMLAEEGATVVEFPQVAIGPPPDPEAVDAAVLGVERFRWVVVCHVSAGLAFVKRLVALRGGVEPLAANCSLAALGPQRKAALEEAGLRVDLVTERASPGEMVRALAEAPGGLAGAPVLVVSGEPAGSIEAGLEALGAEVTALQSVSREATLEGSGEVARLVAAGRIAGVVFLSPGGVARFQKALESCRELSAAAPGLAAYAMSRRTAELALALGFRRVIHPEVRGRQALLEAICNDLAG